MVRTQRKILKILSEPRKKPCYSRPSSSSLIMTKITDLLQIYNDKETNDETEINNHIYSFFNYLYKETLSFSSNNLETYLNTISFPKLTKGKSKTLHGGKELLIALQSMGNNKSPGNDGLTKKFYIPFWNEVKVPFLLAIEKAYLVKQLSASQKQAVIKLIEKKDATNGIFKTGDLFPYLI